MERTGHHRRILLTLSGELFTKTPRTRRRFLRVLEDNLHDALARHAPQARLTREGRRLLVDVDTQATDGHDVDATLEAAGRAAVRVFGIQRADLAVEVPTRSLDELVGAVAERARSQVAGRTFAVRVGRRGSHEWRSGDLARRLGDALLADSAGVDLDDPEVEVRVEVYGEVAYLVERRWDGFGGAPLGTQEPVLSLLSGGFDSPVASWLLMRRGSPVHFLHVMLECAASDHAVGVGHELTRRWAPGHRPLLWKVDFQDVRAALFDATPPRLRQVVLKQLMFTAADRLAERLGIPALLSGESVGQVSSQTLTHLAEIDRVVTRPVLRPLAGHTKDEIIGWARRIGTERLSARAKEVCDLSDGPVAVAAQRETLARAHAALPEDLVARALERLEVVALDGWQPGQPAVPVVGSAPAGVPVVEAGQELPPVGPVAVRGLEGVRRASEAAAAGRRVFLLDEPLERDALDAAG